ncbi:MAG: hypothetical protein EA377_12010 [Phycisphaerales bacterium]|nr:MAG: hypothetical protein EA377_12010 [Phycisphaerales bacterium]
MWKQLFIMAILLAALIGADRYIQHQRADERKASAQVTELFSTAMFLENPVAAFRLITADDREWTYIHDEGIWRSVEAFGAPGIQSRMELLLPSLLSARGVIQAKTSEHQAHFGLGGSERIVIAACGPAVLTDPDGDVIAGIEIGRAIPETNSTFVRRLGEQAIWAVNIDFHDIIKLSEVPGIPPMLDPNIIPEAWPGADVGIQSVSVQRFDGGESYRAQRVERTPADAESSRAVPWEWVIEISDGTYSIDPRLVQSYFLFLVRAPFAGILRPGNRPELGFEDPQAQIDLTTADGEVLRLLVGARQPRGGVAILNSYTQVGYLLDPNLLPLLVPDADVLLGDALDDPWEPHIRPERQFPDLPEGVELPAEMLR